MCTMEIATADERIAVVTIDIFRHLVLHGVLFITLSAIV